MERLVTVYILCYKDLEGLFKSIDSVAKQTYSRIELIISNDGTDNFNLDYYKSVLTQYESRFESIIVNKNPQNVGTVRHSNIVLQMAHGEILCPLSAGDEFYQENTISHIVEYFDNHPEDIILASKRIDQATGEVLPTKRCVDMIRNKPERFRRVMLRMGMHYLSGAGTYFRKELFEKHGAFLEDDFFLLEDGSYFEYLVVKNQSFGILDEITCVHEAGGVSDTSSSNENSSIAWNEYIDVFKKVLYPERNRFDTFTKRCIEFQVHKWDAYRKGKSQFLCKCKYLDSYIYIAIYWSKQKFQIKRNMERK